MVARFAREYEGRVTFLTSPGLDSQEAMEQAVKDFKWPASMIHAVDENGGLWRHLNVLYRGAWIFLDDDGKVLHQSVSHLPEKQVKENLERLVAS
jgi:hypothetical protein